MVTSPRRAAFFVLFSFSNTVLLVIMLCGPLVATSPSRCGTFYLYVKLLGRRVAREYFSPTLVDRRKTVHQHRRRRRCCTPGHPNDPFRCRTHTTSVDDDFYYSVIITIIIVRLQYFRLYVCNTSDVQRSVRGVVAYSIIIIQLLYNCIPVRTYLCCKQFAHYNIHIRVSMCSVCVYSKHYIGRRTQTFSTTWSGLWRTTTRVGITISIENAHL